MATETLKEATLAKRFSMWFGPFYGSIIYLLDTLDYFNWQKNKHTLWTIELSGLITRL